MAEYISVDMERTEPTCGDRGCEQMEHWATVYLGPDILDPVKELRDAMRDFLAGPRDTANVRRARRALSRVSKMIKAVEGVAL